MLSEVIGSSQIENIIRPKENMSVRRLNIEAEFCVFSNNHKPKAISKAPSSTAKTDCISTWLLRTQANHKADAHIGKAIICFRVCIHSPGLGNLDNS